MALHNVEWEACVLEPRPDPELEGYVRRTLGVVPSSVAYFTPVPWLVRSMASLSYQGSPLVHLDYVVADLLGLVVSQDNSCRYCFAIQELMMRIHGFSPKRLRRLEQDFLEAEIDPRQKLVLDLARRISRASPLTAAADAAPLLAAGWSRAEIRELVFHAAYTVFMNRVMSIPAIPPQRDERMAEHWVLGWVAPFLRLSMRRHWRPGRSASLPAEARTGPWSRIVLALEGLPVALRLRETIDAALTSTVLPRRTKVLIFAVVARALGCPIGEHEVRELAAQEGIGEAELESIVTHLGSPELDPIEAALVPFARVTARARPVQLQQRARALRETLSLEQVVEAVGVCALANALCRLGMVADLQ